MCELSWHFYWSTVLLLFAEWASEHSETTDLKWYFDTQMVFGTAQTLRTARYLYVKNVLTTVTNRHDGTPIQQYLETEFFNKMQQYTGMGEGTGIVLGVGVL